MIRFYWQRLVRERIGAIELAPEVQGRRRPALKRNVRLFWSLRWPTVYIPRAALPLCDLSPSGWFWFRQPRSHRLLEPVPPFR